MKKILAKIDKPLFIVMTIFLIFGLIMILSASSMESYMRYGASPYNYFFKQLLFIIVGLFAFMIVIFFPTKNYRKLASYFLYGMILALLGLLVYGYTSNNAQSWYDLGFFNFQPSELTKVAIILYFAMYYEKNKNKLDNQWIIIVPLLLTMVIASLVAIQPDMGTSAIIILISLLIFYAVPIENKYRKTFNKILIGGIAIVLAGFVATKGAFLNDYQLERFNFFDPCERYQEDSGYQLCNSYIAFKNGGLLGQGLGESTQKYLYLPESYTDFIFPIIVEEWGLLVGILILGGYIFILYRIFKLAKRANNLHNSLIAYGVFIYILLHISINLIGVLGLGPLTGVPLPFLSYGGSYTLTLLFALGLVQRVAIESNIAKTKKQLKQ